MRLRALILSLGTTLSGCATLPPDIIACKSLDPVAVKLDGKIVSWLDSPTCKANLGEGRCGYCTYTISNKNFYVGNEPNHRYQGRTWDQLLDRSVILPAKESYGPLKAYIIEQCRQTNCDAAISDWKFKLDSLDRPPVKGKP